jgi:hypothetical protein
MEVEEHPMSNASPPSTEPRPEAASSSPAAEHVSKPVRDFEGEETEVLMQMFRARRARREGKPLAGPDIAASQSPGT